MKSRNDDAPRHQAESSITKKSYRPPLLTTFGSVNELTTQLGSDDGQPAQGPGGF